MPPHTTLICRGGIFTAAPQSQLCGVNESRSGLCHGRVVNSAEIPLRIVVGSERSLSGRPKLASIGKATTLYGSRLIPAAIESNGASRTRCKRQDAASYHLLLLRTRLQKPTNPGRPPTGEIHLARWSLHRSIAGLSGKIAVHVRPDRFYISTLAAKIFLTSSC